MNCLKCGAMLPFGQHIDGHNEKFVDMMAWVVWSHLCRSLIKRFPSENEANKRKLQQMQVKYDQSETKEQGTLSKLQECIHMLEQSQFERNEVCLCLVCCFAFFNHRHLSLGYRRTGSNQDWTDGNPETSKEVHRRNDWQNHCGKTDGRRLVCGTIERKWRQSRSKSLSPLAFL